MINERMKIVENVLTQSTNLYKTDYSAIRDCAYELNWTDIVEYTNILALFYIYYSFSFKDNFDTNIIICENFV